MKKNKKTSNDTKKIATCIVLTIIVLIIGVLLYEKLVPIYNVKDRTQILGKKIEEDDTVKGWLKVQGTNIDYPVVYAYSDKFKNGEYDYDYLWTNSDSSELNTRTLVWGHNIRNVSSKPLINEKSFNYLENLPSFLYYDFVKENKYIQYTINGKNYVYKIFAVQMLDKSDFSTDEYMTEKERKAYIDKSIKNSYFNFDIDVNPKNNIITVATCTRFFSERTTILKIDGVQVEEGKRLTDYKVKKNKSYNKIEKTMKGDVNDETEEA